MGGHLNSMDGHSSAIKRKDSGGRKKKGRRRKRGREREERRRK